MTAEAPRRIALRLRLASGLHAVALDRVTHVAGYATLSGDGDELFLGWLAFHGEQVPVFDLNRAVCDEATAETFGSRILIVSGKNLKHIGLLAPEVTDTVASNDADVLALDLDQYIPMLESMVPARPA